VYVCICNALTDRRLKQAAADAGCVRPSDAYEACGCRAQCGKCVKAVLAILRDQLAEAQQFQGAD
jgi:bacterioferritin-associated ferredoxin